MTQNQHPQREVAAYSVNIVKTVGLGMVFMSLFIVGLIVAVMGGIGYVAYSTIAQPRPLTQFTSPGKLTIPLPDLGQYLILGDASAWKGCAASNAKSGGPAPAALSAEELAAAGGLGLGAGPVVGGFKVSASGEYVIDCQSPKGSAPAAFTLAIRPETTQLASLLESIGLSTAISLGFSLVIGLGSIAAFILIFFLFRRHSNARYSSGGGFGGTDNHGTL